LTASVAAEKQLEAKNVFLKQMKITLEDLQQFW
jgi:hypothetical protein